MNAIASNWVSSNANKISNFQQLKGFGSVVFFSFSKLNCTCTNNPCCKTCIKPSTKLAITSNIGFVFGAFWLKVFNVKVLQGYYIFWIMTKKWLHHKKILQ
jgi:hypothetical protein